MTNVTDIERDSLPVQSRTLRETEEDISTQGTVVASRSVMNDMMRDIAKERLNNNDLRLPIRNRVNDILVGDAEDFRNLNEHLDRETIRNILETIANERFDSNILRNIISGISVETLDRARNILSQPSPVFQLQDFAPILNMICYANVGFNDFNASITYLHDVLTDLNSSQNLYQNNLVEEAKKKIDEIINNANNNVKERREEYNRERLMMLNSSNCIII